jgi:hypothetical protein
VHEPTATVLESLLFSARLRQSYNTPDAEKVLYVHRIMDLLELTPLQHAFVGSKLASIPASQGTNNRDWLRPTSPRLVSVYLSPESQSDSFPQTYTFQVLAAVCRLSNARDLP